MDKILEKVNSSFVGMKNILEDMLIKKLIKTVSIVLAVNTGASVLNFITFTIVVNKLGAKLLGILVLTQTYTGIINSIFNIQTWESVIKFGHSDQSERKLEYVVKVNFLMDLISALIAFAISIILAKPLISFFKWDPVITDLILLYSLTIPFDLVTFRVGIPRLFDKLVFTAKIQAYMSILKMIFVLLAAFKDQTITTYVVIFLIVDILNSVIHILYSLHLLNSNGYSGWLKAKINFDPHQMRFIWWTNLRSIMRIPVQYFDMIIISMVMPLETVGVYKVYKETAGFLNKISDPVNQAIYPEYAKLIGGNNDRGAVSLAKKTILVLFIVSMGLTAFLIFSSQFFIGRFYGQEFLPLINGLYLLIGLYGVSFFIMPVNALFIAAGFAKLGFYIVVFTNLLYLLVAFLFGKLFGIYGIITAYGVQMLFNQGLKVFFLKKYRMGWSNTIR